MRRIYLGQIACDIHSLGEAMDAAFDRLYQSGAAGLPTHLDREFKDAALQYFDSKDQEDTGAHDHFFYGFSPLWNYYRSLWRFDWAEGIWKLALAPALAWEEIHANKWIHKGVPYYLWAITALLRGSIDNGYVLAHQAAVEDRRNWSGLGYPDTPAFALVSLNYNKEDQAFKSWVDEQARFLEAFIADYNKTHARAFSIDDLRDKFLHNPPSLDTVFSLIHTIARLKEISGIPADAKRNPFAGQLQLNLLFDLLLVIDGAIKHKNSSQWKFSELATYFLDKSGHRLPQFAKLNGQFNQDFGKTLSAALNGTVVIDGNVLDRLQADFAVAYGLRNRGAHDIESEPVIWTDFDRVLKAVFRTFFATVDHLY